MKLAKNDLIYLLDIRDAIHEIGSFLADGVRDLRTYRAVEREIEIIGEACSRISIETQAKYPNIAWREIKAMRNIIVHEYSRVSFDMVWNVVDNEIQDLLAQIENVIKAYGE
jgi:uncharacterized protein with HEPN domain